MVGRQPIGTWRELVYTRIPVYTTLMPTPLSPAFPSSLPSLNGAALLLEMFLAPPLPFVHPDSFGILVTSTPNTPTALGLAPLLPLRRDPWSGASQWKRQGPSWELPSPSRSLPLGNLWFRFTAPESITWWITSYVWNPICSLISLVSGIKAPLPARAVGACLWLRSLSWPRHLMDR